MSRSHLYVTDRFVEGPSRDVCRQVNWRPEGRAMCAGRVAVQYSKDESEQLDVRPFDFLLRGERVRYVDTRHQHIRH
jgi:hypothetical protein